MKHFLFTFSLISFLFFYSDAQESQTTKVCDLMMVKDSTPTQNRYCNIISVGTKYYFKTLNNTRTILAANGFQMEQEAVDLQVRLYNLPKIFYFQQLGILANNNYASVTGFGVKEDLRWNIVKNSNFVFTPYVEVGGGYYRMNIAKGISSNSISTVLSSTVESYYLDNFALTGDIGLDLGYGFDIDNRRLSIIFNGGYIVNFPAEWRMGGSLAFKEKIDLGSPYAGVTVRLEMNCNKCCEGGQCK